MTTTLCTLFDSRYLDKGLVLFDSLKDNARDFELYVLCMDEKCFEVLSGLNESRLKPIKLEAIENNQMLVAKSNRGPAEYCWTCTSRLLQYILEFYKPECCTYIDADMYFYNDPGILVEEMLSNNCSVMMVPHRFTPDQEEYSKIVGKYCVEFNCFINNLEGRSILDSWHNQCLECCSNIGDGVHWGDQKYMDEWPDKYKGIVHVCGHPGAGIAPWNIKWYKDIDIKNYSVLYKKDESRYLAIFFHYQGIAYLSRKVVEIGLEDNVPDIDYNLLRFFYQEYLEKIEVKKQFLEKNHQLNYLIRQHPFKSKKHFKSILKRYSFFRRVRRIFDKNYVPYIITLK